MTLVPVVAPAPEVQHLPTVFRRIQQGDVRMPAFQRGFVWDAGQVLDLLESINNGFPIGSILLWRVNQREMKVEGPEGSYFPPSEETYPTHYILDGFQRLSALYAAFHYDPAVHPPKVSVAFDLENREFIPMQPSQANAIPLNIVFKPTEFIKYHSRLSARPGGSSLINNAVRLLTTFQEYLLPLVTIAGREVDDVVQMFERINSTGTRLSSVDFMRAVTWSEDFDLNRELDRIGSVAKSLGFNVPQETLVKVLAIALDYSPAAESMLRMRDLPAPKLMAGVKRSIAIVRRVGRFLNEHLHVHSYTLIPYEGQFLSLVGFFSVEGKHRAAALEQLVRWYWTVSLNEDMQGRSEHQVARIVADMKALRKGTRSQLSGRLSVAASALIERRFRWGTALSSALAGMLAQNGCRSVVSGDVIAGDEFLSGDAGPNYVGVFDEKDVAQAFRYQRPTGKVVANMIAVADEDKAIFKTATARQVIRQLTKKKRRECEQILMSQFITPQAMQSILKGRVLDFLEQRAEAIMAFARDLTFEESR